MDLQKYTSGVNNATTVYDVEKTDKQPKESFNFLYVAVNYAMFNPTSKTNYSTILPLCFCLACHNVKPIQPEETN